MWLGYIVLIFELVSYLFPIVSNTFTWTTGKLTWVGVLNGGLFQGFALIGVGKLLVEQAKR
jgi:hypothetical protein